MRDDVRDLLRDWGQWMREDQAMPRGIGYPEQAIGADQMAPPPARSQGEREEADRIARLATRSPRRTRTREDGTREVVRHMIPQGQPSETRASKARSPEYEPAPLDIRACHRAVLSLPEKYRDALIARYALGWSIREIGDSEGISYLAAREFLARAEGCAEDRMRTAA